MTERIERGIDRRRHRSTHDRFGSTASGGGFDAQPARTGPSLVCDVAHFDTLAGDWFPLPEMGGGNVQPDHGAWLHPAAAQGEDVSGSHNFLQNRRPVEVRTKPPTARPRRTRRTIS